MACLSSLRYTPSRETNKASTEPYKATTILQNKKIMNYVVRQSLANSVELSSHLPLQRDSKCLYQMQSRQLISLLNRPSHCDACHMVKIQRTHHCSICKKCILRMQHHCFILDTCIGSANHKIFIQYLAFSFLLNAYISATCLFNSVAFSKQLTHWPHIKYSLYILLAATHMAISIVFGMQLFTTVKRAKQNITAVEANIKSFQQHNPFAAEDYWHKLFPRLTDFFSMQYQDEQFGIQLVEENPINN